MGGDTGPQLAYDSAVKFLNKNSDYKIVAFATETFKPVTTHESIEIIYSENFIDHDAQAMSILRVKNNTLATAFDYVNEGKAEALVSASSSAPLVAGGFMKFKAIEGLKPAFTPIFTGFDLRPRIILDAGANIETTPEMLVNYAMMGEEYAKAIGISQNPITKLVNIGSEDTKGDALRKEAFKLLSDKEGINFKGNLESNVVLTDDYDVAVIDAYSGNILIKAVEGVMFGFKDHIKAAADKSMKTKLGLLVAKDSIKVLKQIAYHEFAGAAVVLGLNKILIKIHGSQRENEVISGLNIAKTLIEKDIVNSIKGNIEHAKDN